MEATAPLHNPRPPMDPGTPDRGVMRVPKWFWPVLTSLAAIAAVVLKSALRDQGTTREHVSPAGQGLQGRTEPFEVIHTHDNEDGAGAGEVFS
ncbi:MAG: hypothetical protein ACRDGN_03380 [bacterium]